MESMRDCVCVSLPDGSVQIFPHPITAGHVLSKFPSHALALSSSSSNPWLDESNFLPPPTPLHPTSAYQLVQLNYQSSKRSSTAHYSMVSFSSSEHSDDALDFMTAGVKPTTLNTTAAGTRSLNLSRRRSFGFSSLSSMFKLSSSNKKDKLHQSRSTEEVESPGPALRPRRQSLTLTRMSAGSPHSDVGTDNAAPRRKSLSVPRNLGGFSGCATPKPAVARSRDVWAGLDAHNTAPTQAPPPHAAAAECCNCNCKRASVDLGHVMSSPRHVHANNNKATQASTLGRELMPLDHALRPAPGSRRMSLCRDLEASRATSLLAGDIAPARAPPRAQRPIQLPLQPALGPHHQHSPEIHMAAERPSPGVNLWSHRSISKTSSSPSALSPPPEGFLDLEAYGGARQAGGSTPPPYRQLRARAAHDYSVSSSNSTSSSSSSDSNGMEVQPVRPLVGLRTPERSPPEGAGNGSNGGCQRPPRAPQQVYLGLGLKGDIAQYARSTTAHSNFRAVLFPDLVA